MRYLMDSLQSYESGHGDALNPHRLQADKSFMGDHDALQAPSIAEFRLLSEQILTKLDNVSLSTPSNTHPTSSTAATTTTATTTPNSPGPSLIPGNSSGGSTPPIPPDQNQPAIHPTATIPIPGVLIPGVGRDASAWRRAIDQWYFGDNKVGLKPLKDWPLHYYTGAMRLVTGTLYSNRKLLAMEYER